MAKRIILLLDGTWNDSDFGAYDTNIVRMREAISRTLRAKGSSKQEAVPDSSPETRVEPITTKDLLCRRTPTVASVAGRGCCYNTVAKVWVEAYAIAKSRIPAPRTSASRKGLFRGNPANHAVTPLPGQAAAPVARPFPVLNSLAAETETPASPDKPLTIDPAGDSGPDPADLNDDHVDQTLKQLAAEFWMRFVETGDWTAKADTSTDTLRAAPRRQVRISPAILPAGVAFASFRAVGIRSYHTAERAA